MIRFDPDAHKEEVLWRMNNWFEKDKKERGLIRPYTAEDVVRLRGPFGATPPHTKPFAHEAADRLWDMLSKKSFVRALGIGSGQQAVQMAKAGLLVGYVSGWQTAADANANRETLPDQSIYDPSSVPLNVDRINRALWRAVQIEWQEKGEDRRSWMMPLIADAEAGFGGLGNVYMIMKQMIEAGAACVHFEDQLGSEKKCGHLAGKVLVPVKQFIRTLIAARLTADIMGTGTLIIARTDAEAATLLTTDADERDHPFLVGERTDEEGHFRYKCGMDACVMRGLAYAPYADLLWMETKKADLEQAREFAARIHEKFPGKWLAYNCSPSFPWVHDFSEKFDLDPTKPEDMKKLKKLFRDFQKELGEMGYKFIFVTLAGFHALNESMFRLAYGYNRTGMGAYVDLQERENALHHKGFTAVKHQREVGTGWFDAFSQVVTGGKSSTTAMKGSTEERFKH